MDAAQHYRQQRPTDQGAGKTEHQVRKHGRVAYFIAGSSLARYVVATTEGLLQSEQGQTSVSGAPVADLTGMRAGCPGGAKVNQR